MVGRKCSVKTSTTTASIYCTRCACHFHLQRTVHIRVYVATAPVLILVTHPSCVNLANLIKCMSNSRSYLLTAALIMCSCPYDMDIHVYEVEDTFTAGSLVSPSSETHYRIDLDSNAIVHQHATSGPTCSKTIQNHLSPSTKLTDLPTNAGQCIATKYSLYNLTQ